MAKILVRAQIGSFPGPRDVTVEMNLSEDLARDTFEPIDLPSRNADGFSRMLCSSEVRVRYVTRLRADLARYLSAELTTAILKVMQAHDTEMGCPKGV